MKGIVTPTINGRKREYPVLAGIEAEVDIGDNRVFQPRIYLIKKENDVKALYFCYRKGQRDGRKGGYGMFLDEGAIRELNRNPTDTHNLTELKRELQNLADSIPV